jgi:hypothetical protein
MAIFHTTLAIIILTNGKITLKVPVFKTVIDVVRYENGSHPRYGTFQLVPYLVGGGELWFTLLTAAFFLLSALFHLLNATLLRKYYISELQRCRTPTRWVEYTLSAPIMIVIIAYTLGIRERMLLATIATLIAITMPFGYWVEVISRPVSLQKWSRPLQYRLLPWILGNIPQSIAWIVIFFQFYGEIYDGGGESDLTDRIPSFVYIIIWGELLLFTSFGFACLLSQLNTPQNFYKGELLFQVLSLVSKGLLGGVLLAQVLMLSNFDDIYSN